MRQKNKVFTNIIWRFLERVGAQLVSFIVSIVLARILAPEDYGTIALVTVFTTILNVFVDSGLGTALVQKKDADDLDFSTVFWFNILTCCLLYLLMFACAPLISNFYSRPDLIPVIRVLCLTIVISGVKNIQNAYVSKHLLFKKFFFSTLSGTIGAAILGIFMAYKGMGVWALVAQQLFNLTVDTIILWITVKFRPKRIFSFERLKGLFNFGYKLLLSSLIDTTYTQLRQLIIGKKYSSTDLAYYNKGEQFPNIIAYNINLSIDSVLLPTMSEKQDDKERVKAMTKRSIKVAVYVMVPLMLGLAATSTRVIEILLTSKWLECVPYLCIFCVSFIFYPVDAANLNAIKAMGRSDLFLKLEIIKKIVGLCAILITMFISPLAMCISVLITSFICQIINAYPNTKLLNYPIYEQWKDMLPSILCAIVMAIIVYITGSLLSFLPNIVTLIIQVIEGALIYIIESYIFKIDSFNYVLNLLKPYLSRNK